MKNYTKHLYKEYLKVPTKRRHLLVERLWNKSTKSSSVEDKAYRERPVPFYNWLNERDSLPQSIVQCEPSLENWLKW
jgi:hypothetical protein